MLYAIYMLYVLTINPHKSEATETLFFLFQIGRNWGTFTLNKLIIVNQLSKWPELHEWHLSGQLSGLHSLLLATNLKCSSWQVTLAHMNLDYASHKPKEELESQLLKNSAHSSGILKTIACAKLFESEWLLMSCISNSLTISIYSLNVLLYYLKHFFFFSDL